jgi:glycerol-3-phosphate dehydrogenase
LEITKKFSDSQTPRIADVDCLILGGGITGAGIARDAAIRGLKILLVDSHDFASGTSHLTSKLIHGGLRYLPQGKFKLVIEGITERDRLLNQIAPHLVRPLRFIVPYPWSKFINWLTTATGTASDDHVWVQGVSNPVPLLRLVRRRGYRSSKSCRRCWKVRRRDGPWPAPG